MKMHPSFCKETKTNDNDDRFEDWNCDTNINMFALNVMEERSELDALNSCTPEFRTPILISGAVLLACPRD